MAFLFRKRKKFVQSDTQAWKKEWQSLLPPQCRDVPITVDGRTVIAYVQINQFVMMLQDGLLMEAEFFDVCRFFQAAGYHVIWLMRCTQDIANGYLKCKGGSDDRYKWLWKSPTTNFGRWTSDNFNATIILQHAQIPAQGLANCNDQILQRVTWAESDDPAKMIPGKTQFFAVDTPGTPQELVRWLEGTPLSKVKNA